MTCCLPLRAMCPSGTLLWRWNLWLGPFRAGPATDPGRGPTPFRKVIFHFCSTSRGCVRAYAHELGGGTAEGNVELDVKDRNDGLKMKREDVSCLHSGRVRCKCSYLWCQKFICESIMFAELFWLCLCGWMKVIHSERGRQCIHRAEIMLLFGIYALHKGTFSALHSSRLLQCK